MESWIIADEILIADHCSAAARGRYVTIGGDDSNNFRDLHVFIEKQTEVCVRVTGSRFKDGIEPGAMPQNLP